jgi:hypothetical protein
MARPRKPPTGQARIADFANAELQQLVDELYAERQFEASAVTLLGALVLAARRLPHDVVIALIPAYLARERAEGQLVDAGEQEAEA